MRVIILIIGLLSFNGMAQVAPDTALMRIENRLAILLQKLRNAPNDTERDLHNLTLFEELKVALRKPGVLDYPFAKLTTMSTIKSPDGAFRIFNWNVETDQLTHKHYCFVVKRGRVKGRNRVIVFKEDKITIPPEPSTMLTPNRWYGALYYKIIPLKKGGKTLYTVMGFNGHTRSSNKKILDVFWFRGNSLKLGYPIFEESENSTELKRRIFFEYSEKATVSVKFLADIGKIVFNHLTPESDNLKGLPEFYVPDLTYDAYYWKNGVWKYQKDIQVGNKTEKKIKVYNPNYDPDAEENEEDSEEYRVQRVRWEDPTGKGSAGGSEKHVVVQVENDGKKRIRLRKKRQSKPKKKRTKKRKSVPHSAIKLN